MTIGTIIAKRRKEFGLTQVELAEAAGISQSTMDRIERDDFKRTPSALPSVASVLRLELSELDPKLAERATFAAPHREAGAFKPHITPGNELVGARDFPIYAAAEGGNGHLIVSFDAIEVVKRPAILEGVKGAYGLLVMGESMIPAYRQGDMALIHPHLPPARDEDVVLYDHPPDGEAEAIVKHLVGWTDKEWILEQYRPPREWREFKVDWPTCHRVVGKYARR